MSHAERNKQIIEDFLDLVHVHHDPRAAVEKHMGSTYLQHNPFAADGPDAFVEAMQQIVVRAGATVERKRIVADGDLVAVHVHVRDADPAMLGLEGIMDPQRGLAAMDFFRLDDAGKIVEHWDVIQPVPEHAANENGMF